MDDKRDAEDATPRTLQLFHRFEHCVCPGTKLHLLPDDNSCSIAGLETSSVLPVAGLTQDSNALDLVPEVTTEKLITLKVP